MATSTREAKPVHVLFLEGVNKSAVEMFLGTKNFSVQEILKALDASKLRDAIHGVELLSIRSRTDLPHDIFANADRLMAVGCFSVGTNQVDLDAARLRGSPVFNAPFSNTRSVAELTIGEITMLLLRVVPRSTAAHQGGWDKSASGSREVRRRTLGIVGYGNIASQLSMLAEAMGMRVSFFDRTDKLRHRACREPRESSCAERRGQPARTGDVEHGGHDRCKRFAPDEAGLVPDQDQPRYHRRS